MPFWEKKKRYTAKEVRKANALKGEGWTDDEIDVLIQRDKKRPKLPTIEHQLQSEQKYVETRFQCNVCGHVWHVNVVAVQKQNAMAAMSNLGRALTPILWLTKEKQMVDLTHCPSCGTVNIQRKDIRGGGNAAAMQKAQAAHKAQLAQAVQAAQAAPTARQPPLTVDIPEQIEKLAKLKEHGILTTDEFESKKQELLSRI